MRLSLHNQHQRGDGRSFYRLMALIGALSGMLFGAAFIFVLDHTYEPVWDRILIVGLCFAVWIASGFRSMNNKQVYHLSTSLFYLFALHILWTCYNNHFDWTYVLSFILTLQAVTISFRDDKQAGPFVIIICSATFVSVVLSDLESVQSKVVVISAIVISTLLLFLVVRIRSRFYHKIRAQEDVLRAIVASSEDGVLITDMDGMIQDANVQAAQMLGRNFKDLFGLYIGTLRAKQLTQTELSALLEELHAKGMYSSEYELIRGDETTFISYTTINLVRESGRQFLVYRIKDFTERREFQQSLISAKEEAERAAEMKSQFLATVSHEVRTPLNGIMGMTELVLDTELNENQREYLEQIRASNDHLLFIVNDILDFSKVERGKMELDPQPFEVASLVRHAAKTFEGPAKAKGLSYIVQLEPGLEAPLLGDAPRIKQILLNLLGNAVKFTEEGSITFEVGRSPRGISFAVTDSGIGIPEDKLGRMFDAFSQVDASHSRKFGGTGLGLAICKQLATLMEGDLTVESALGKGSTFRLELPLQEAGPPVSAAPPAAPQPGHMPPPLELPTNLRVMLAEDNAINQHVGKLILNQMGIEADVAENGKEVLEKLRDQDYDIIFMDLQMPEMDGLEATRLILDPEGEFNHKPVIVAMTANAMPQDIAMCKSVGMRGFVSKPIILQDLHDALKESLAILGRRA